MGARDTRRGADRASARGRQAVCVGRLLEGSKGERLVRFAYSTGGTARRGPVTLRARDLERLVQGLSDCPQLAETLGFGGVKEGANGNA
jgi:hypothetical protein